MKKTIRVTIIVAGMALCANAAIATGLYAVDGAVAGGGGAPSTLYELDPATGAVIRTIGATGFDGVKGLAIHPTAGIICGVVSNGYTGQRALITLDPLTGAGNQVGPSFKLISDIAFSADGVLYGWSETNDENDLVTIDLSTGLATVVADSGLSTASTGLSFDGLGRLILKDQQPSLYVLDTGTGLPTYLADLQPSPTTRYRNVLAYNPENGLMYTAEWGTEPPPLYTFDPAAGVNPIPTTVIGTGPSGLTALAFGEAIPTEHGMNGRIITADWLYPDMDTVIETHPVVVGLAVELPASAIGMEDSYSIDLGGRRIRFDFNFGFLWTAASFNGWSFSDTEGTLPDIVGLSIADISAGVTGLEEADLSWDADTARIDFSGVHIGDAGDYVVLEIELAVFNDGFESGDTSAWSAALP